MKRCFKCSAIKPLDQFYVHKMMADGHLNKCKECTKRDVKERYEAKPFEISSYERARFQTPDRKAKVAEYQRARRKKDPVKDRARALVNYAVRVGHLVPRPCESCGTAIGVQAHHDNYSRPLDVRWLCFEHHREAHGQRTLARKLSAG